jgi:hypothetical protein
MVAKLCSTSAIWLEEPPRAKQLEDLSRDRHLVRDLALIKAITFNRFDYTKFPTAPYAQGSQIFRINSLGHISHVLDSDADHDSEFQHTLFDAHYYIYERQHISKMDVI